MIYTLIDTDSEAIIEQTKSAIVQQNELIAQMERDIERSELSPSIFKVRDVENYRSQLKVAEAKLTSLKADLKRALFTQDRKTVTAPFDG